MYSAKHTLLQNTISLFSILYFLHQEHRYKLNKQNKEYHSYRIDSSISYSRDITIGHRVAAAKPGVLVIPPVIVPSKSSKLILKTKRPTNAAISIGTRVINAPTPNSRKPLS